MACAAMSMNFRLTVMIAEDDAGEEVDKEMQLPDFAVCGARKRDISLAVYWWTVPVIQTLPNSSSKWLAPTRRRDAPISYTV